VPGYSRPVLVVGCAVDPELVAGRTERASEAALQDEALGALRVSGSEQARHGAALGDRMDRGPLPGDGIQDNVEVLHPLLERRRILEAV
jgi:hypothetical protein